MAMSARFERFFRQVQRDFRLWLFFTAALTVYRVVFILIFREEIGDGGRLHSLLAALLTGLRFDAQAATYWMLAPLAASLLCLVGDEKVAQMGTVPFSRWEAAANRVRAVTGLLFAFATPLISVVAVQYYREYHDVFDQMLFHVGDDDTAAILATLYHGYNLVTCLTLAAVLGGLATIAGKHWALGPLLPRRWTARLAEGWVAPSVAALFVGLSLVAGLRGSLGRVPLQTKSAAVTSDRLLNKAVLNPYVALADAACLRRQMAGSRGLKSFLPDGDIRAALRRAFPGAPAADNIDRYLQRTAAGPRIVPPRHVFLICMESYDAWPLEDKYAGLDLVPQGRRLAREGLHLRAFLPAGSATIDSNTAILTGIPYASLCARYEPYGRRDLPTSLPTTFHRLGYRTRFFYGGSLSWQNIGDFARDQGFDEVYGAGHLEDRAPANEWGVADQYLFDFVARTVRDDRPSFNYVVSTSYHPPYNLDLRSLGVPLPRVPPELEAEFRGDRPALLNLLGHLRYADRELGRFVDSEEARLPRPLFAVTGDHWSRRFINGRPTLFERSAVPLILYGKEVLRGAAFPPGCAGSHIDLAPTLIEAAAPRGFRYYALGQNLLAPRARFLGFNLQWMIDADEVVEVKSENHFAPVPGRSAAAPPADFHAQLLRMRAFQGVAWWRLRNGPELR
jgi:phosphoglycerol transferase MdoB-like AlkP superfamily enzyme